MEKSSKEKNWQQISSQMLSSSKFVTSTKRQLICILEGEFQLTKSNFNNSFLKHRVLFIYANVLKLSHDWRFYFIFLQFKKAFQNLLGPEIVVRKVNFSKLSENLLKVSAEINTSNLSFLANCGNNDSKGKRLFLNMIVHSDIVKGNYQKWSSLIDIDQLKNDLGKKEKNFFLRWKFDSFCWISNVQKTPFS